MSDSIVDEVHKAREKLWDAANGDWQKLVERMRAGESTHPERLVTREQFERKQKARIEKLDGTRA